MRRISLLAQKNAPLRLAFAEGELTVSARTPGRRRGAETLPVPFQGEPLEIGFNPEFLRDGLEAVESGDVLLKLISPLRPGLIEAADGSGFLYLLMPIRLNVVRDAPSLRRRPRLSAAQLPLLRGGGGAAGPGPDGRHGPQRRRQDEPARGDLLRLHRAARAGRRTSARCVRFGAGVTRLELDARATTASAHAHHASASSRARRSACTVDGAPVERLTDVGGAPARLGLPARPAGAGARARRRCGARTSTRSSPRCGRPASATRRAYAAALGAAQRAARRRSAPAAPAAARCRRGTPSSPATASR